MLNANSTITCDECGKDLLDVGLMVAGNMREGKSCLHLCTYCILQYVTAVFKTSRIVRHDITGYIFPQEKQSE